MEGVLARGRGFELDELLGPFQHKPFHDSMTLSELDIIHQLIDISFFFHVLMPEN